MHEQKTGIFRSGDHTTRSSWRNLSSHELLGIVDESGPGLRLAADNFKGLVLERHGGLSFPDALIVGGSVMGLAAALDGLKGLVLERHGGLSFPNALVVGGSGTVPAPRCSNGLTPEMFDWS